MDVGARVRIARKQLGLTTTEFGNRIGISNAAVSMMERGKNSVSQSNIRSIVREFGIREDWLRTGEGEIFIGTIQQEQLAAFMAGILNDDESFKLRLISTLSRLTEDEWAMLEHRLAEITEKPSPE